MDPSTIVGVLTAHMLCSAALMALIGRNMPPANGLNTWATAFGLFGASYAMRLVLGLNSPSPLAPLFDTAMVAATLLFRLGLRQFTGVVTAGWRLPAAAALVFVLLQVTLTLLFGVVGRYGLLNGVLGLLYATLTATAWRSLPHVQPGIRQPLRLLIGLTAVLAVLTLGRSGHILLAGAAVAYAGPYAAVYYAYSAVYALLLAMTLQWMVFVRVNQQLADLATRDPLTRLLNRSGLEEALARHFGRREAPALAVLALDLDHFKTVNDQHGHAAGDRLLSALAGALMRHVRPSDLVARVGGEEFLICCQAPDAEAARQLAERLRGAAAALALGGDGPALRCTVSIGVSLWLSSGEELAVQWAAADRALYAAKAAGRNRVEVA